MKECKAPCSVCSIFFGLPSQWLGKPNKRDMDTEVLGHREVATGFRDTLMWLRPGIQNSYSRTQQLSSAGPWQSIISCTKTWHPTLHPTRIPPLPSHNAAHITLGRFVDMCQFFSLPFPPPPKLLLPFHMRLTWRQRRGWWLPLGRWQQQRLGRICWVWTSFQMLLACWSSGGESALQHSPGPTGIRMDMKRGEGIFRREGRWGAHKEGGRGKS